MTLASTSHHTMMIITAENLHRELSKTKELENLKAVLSDLCDNILVVCYFRDQSELRESPYSTALAQSETGSIDDFHSHINEDYYYYNYFISASNWSVVFGRDCVDFRIYDRNSLVDGDIRSDFLRVMPRGIDKSALVFEPGGANESLAFLQGKVFQIINMNIRYRTTEGNINEVNRLYKRIFRSSQALKIGKIIDQRKWRFPGDFKVATKCFSRNLLN